MRKLWNFRKRFLSLVLCAGLLIELLPPVRVQAEDSFALSASELSASGVPVVPDVLTEDSTFMNQFVRKGSSLNINSSFVLYNSENVSGAPNTLSSATFSRNKNDDWYAQYKWVPSDAEKKALESSLVLVFESKVTPDYHTHNYVFASTSHWSTAGVRINSGDWEYGVNDRGGMTNGNMLYSAKASTTNDGQAQSVTTSWTGNPIKDTDGYMSFNAYSSWDINCGNPKVSGTVFYFKDTSYPYVTDVSISTGNYVSLLKGDVTGTVTLTFSEPIRLADNAEQRNLQLELDAYYGAQSGKVENSDYPLYATLTSLEGNQLVFSFTVPKEAKHIYIKGVTVGQEVPSDAVSLLDTCDLYVYDEKGAQISNTNLTSKYQITDLAGNPMNWQEKTLQTVVFDGVQPTLTKIVMSGKDITAVSTEPARDWNANSGNNKYVYAGAGDKITFQAVFSENIHLSGNAKAVLSIKDVSGAPVELDVKSTSGNTVTFNELTITDEMKEAGERIYITAFKDMIIKDYCGNETSSTLNPNGLMPAQEIALDADKPMVSTTPEYTGGVYAPLADEEGEYFTVPIMFKENTAASSYSDISGMDASFKLEMTSEGAYSYQWYIDSNQTVDKDKFTSGNGGANQATTGATMQTLSDISHDHLYYIHFRLDPNVIYDYTIENNGNVQGIYFNANLTAQVSDWAGNASEPFTMTLKHQVDTDAPNIAFTQDLHREANGSAGSVNFCADYVATDEYAISKITYDGVLKFEDGSTQDIVQTTLYSATDSTTDSFLREQTGSISYPFNYGNETDDNKKQGSVTINLHVEDYTGKSHTISQTVSFNFVKARNQSYVNETGTALEPVNLAPLSTDATSMQVVTMQAPIAPTDTSATNTARSLLLIPNVNSKDESGNYTGFWMFDPWDWQGEKDSNGNVVSTGGMEYPTNSDSTAGDPIANVFDYMKGYDAAYVAGEGYTPVVSALPGRYYYMTGTMDTENHAGSFTDYKILEVAGSVKDLRDYIQNYYGVLELYFVTTTSIQEFVHTGWTQDSDGKVNQDYPAAGAWNFESSDTVVDTYQIYLANNPVYSVETQAVTDASGADAADKLDYQTGNVPAKSLDNVSVTFKITNTSDSADDDAFKYNQNLLYFSKHNPAVKLYYTGASRSESGGTEVSGAAWNLEEVAEGIYTVNIAEGVCTQNGWYRMDVSLVNWDTEGTSEVTYTTHNVGYFYMDAAKVGITADSYYKEYYHEELGAIADTNGCLVAANLGDLESMIAEGREIVLGLDEIEEEGWSIPTHYLRFTTGAREEGDPITDNADVQLHVYNHTFDAAAGLTGETGLWIASTASKATSHDYLPYLADTSQENPYGTTEEPKLPLVEGYNLLVYEIQNANGEVETKEMVVNAYGEAEEWLLDYKTESTNGVNINSVTVRPMLAVLNNDTGAMDYEAAPYGTKFNYLGSAYSYYEKSYTFTNDLSSEFYLLDAHGNLSVKRLELRDENGELLDIDGNPPDYVAFAYHEGDSMEYSRSGPTFHVMIYGYDVDSAMSAKDVKLIFDPVYSTVLKGETDSQGRVVMNIPLALDENGELLRVDTDGDGVLDEYATWESKDTSYNGIYRTKVRHEGPYLKEDGTIQYEGYVDIEIWGTLKYDEELVEYANENTSYSIGLYASAEDAYGNVKESEERNYPVPNSSYSFMTNTLDAEGEVNGDWGALNANGELGLASNIPFVAINGYGAGEQLETVYNYYGYRQFYTTAPMIVEDGTYTFQVVDYFGENHDVVVDVVDVFGELGIDVAFSETNMTNQDVTITARATGEYDEIVSITSDLGQTGTIDPTDPAKASITVSENCTVTIRTEDGKERVVPIANIDKTLDSVRVIYYDQNYDVLDPALGAESVTAVLVCDTETILTTNGPDTYEFPAGSVKGTEYTFTYEDLAGNAGSITASLPVTLPEPPEEDKEAPTVGVNLYASVQGRYHYLEEISAPEDGTPINTTLGQVRAQKYKLILSIADDSDVKVVVLPTGSTEPDKYDTLTSGSSVEGVSCTAVGKTAALEITENTSFDLYVMDDSGNLTPIIGITITGLDNQAPEFVASYEKGTDENGYTVVTAVFYPKYEADLQEVIIPFSEDVFSRIEQVQIPDETDSTAVTTVDVLRYYHIFSANGAYTFTYQDEVGNIGTATAQVKGLSTDAAKVNRVKWFNTKYTDASGMSYGNVPPEKSDMVSCDITAQLSMSKPISQVELFEYNEQREDGIGAEFASDDVRVNVTATTIDIIYSDNVEQSIVVRFTASESGRKGTYILPAVTCIDKVEPTVTRKSVKLSEDKRSVELTFTTSEGTLLSKKAAEIVKMVERGEIEHAYALTEHTLTLKDAEPVVLYFTDRAGNQVTYKVTENAGVDTTWLEASYSAAADGSEATTEPVKDLQLDVGGTLYIKTNKAAKAMVAEHDYGTLEANTWTALELPAKGGLHVLTLTDVNTNDVVQELVAVWPKDTVAPVITLATASILVQETDTMEALLAAVNSGVTVTDNKDSDVTYTVSGVPTEVAYGLYSLCYTAQDKAGNQSSIFRTLYIMAEGTPILWINDEVGVPYGKVSVKAGEELKLTMENMEEMSDTFVIKYRKGLYTTGQMKYYATTIEDMSMTLTEPGHYTIYIRSQNHQEFVTYIYVEG